MQLQQTVPSSLIASYYEGITSPKRFSEALQQMAELLGCDQASLALWDRRGNWGCAYQALRQQHAWQLSMQDNAMPSVQTRKLVAGLETGKWQILEHQSHLAPALPIPAQ